MQVNGGVVVEDVSDLVLERIGRARVIYVARPSKEFSSANEVVYSLFGLFPHSVILYPLHNFSYVPEAVAHSKGGYLELMDRCIGLLSRCDALILTGAWERSPGCMAEYIYAKYQGKRVYEWTGGRFRELCGDSCDERCGDSCDE